MPWLLLTTFYLGYLQLVLVFAVILRIIAIRNCGIIAKIIQLPFTRLDSVIYFFTTIFFFSNSCIIATQFFATKIALDADMAIKISYYYCFIVSTFIQQDTLIESEVTVKTFIMLQMISISNQCHSLVWWLGRDMFIGGYEVVSNGNIIVFWGHDVRTVAVDYSGKWVICQLSWRLIWIPD